MEVQYVFDYHFLKFHIHKQIERIWTLYFEAVVLYNTSAKGNKYTLFNGLTYNTHGYMYFASCKVFFWVRKKQSIEQWANLVPISIHITALNNGVITQQNLFVPVLNLVKWHICGIINMDKYEHISHYQPSAPKI